MFTRQWLLGLKTSWRTISQCVSLRLVETRGEMEKRLPQWTGWHTKEPLTGECRVKWTCQPGGLGRAVVQCLYPRWVQFVVFASSYRVSFKVAPSLILDHSTDLFLDILKHSLAVLVQIPATYILMYCNASSTALPAVRCFQFREKVLGL